MPPAACREKCSATDKIRQRQSFRIAWIKASQVWITGLKTGEYETQVYAGKVDEAPVRHQPAGFHRMGRRTTDRRGWANELSVGFSGFRGTSDLEIVQKAVADVVGRK